MNKDKLLDQFFTHPLIAKRVVDLVDETYGFENYDYIIEPSMGSGSIFNHLPEQKRVGIDVDKLHPECYQKDYLEWFPSDCGIRWDPLDFDNSKMLVLGNPPFGRNSRLMVDFFKHSRLFSDVIVFIVPASWKKETLHRRLPRDFRLQTTIDLPDWSITYQGEKFPVGCVAQFWSRFDVKIDPSIDWTDLKEVDAKLRFSARN